MVSSFVYFLFKVSRKLTMNLYLKLCVYGMLLFGIDWRINYYLQTECYLLIKILKY